MPLHKKSLNLNFQLVISLVETFKQECFHFQAYLVGCSFDNFSSDAFSRAYIWVLIVLAWLVPMIFIALAYLSILYAVRSDLGIGKSSPVAGSAAEQQRHKVNTQKQEKGIYRQSPIFSSVTKKLFTQPWWLGGRALV